MKFRITLPPALVRPGDVLLSADDHDVVESVSIFADHVDLQIVDSGVCQYGDDSEHYLPHRLVTVAREDVPVCPECGDITAGTWSAEDEVYYCDNGECRLGSDGYDAPAPMSCVGNGGATWE